GLDVELAGQPEQLDQGLAGGGHRIARCHRVLGLDVQHEPVEVGALLHTGGLDLVGHGQHRGVDGVHRDATDLLVAGLVLLGRDVAATALDGQLHLNLAAVVERGDVQVRVVHLHTGRRCDVRRGDRAGALLAQVHDDRLVVLAGDDQGLQVEDNLGDILLDPRDGGELVQHPVDADAGDGGTGDAGQQGPAQGV